MGAPPGELALVAVLELPLVAVLELPLVAVLLEPQPASVADMANAVAIASAR
jgi:hypothetical protein